MFRRPARNWYPKPAIVLSGAGVLCCALAALSAFGAETWKPDRPVELVVPASSGGGQDITARVMQKIMQEQGLAPVPVVVVNKPGGGGNIAYGYLKQHPGDGRFIATATPTMLTNNILDPGSDNYTDFTALGMLYNEYVGFAVNAAGPFKTGRDLIERERKTPGSTTFAFGTSLGNANHIALALAMKAGGADIKKLTIAIYKSSADATLALMGGHVDAVVTPLSTFTPVLQSGRLRLIAVAAPQRVAGNFAGVPTWREQGIDAVAPSYRAIIGPKGMSPEQIAYWDNVFQQLVQSETWKKELERNEWESTFMKSAETRKYLDAQYAGYRSILAELGLVK
jgi:putative tricarboxylic transport membrane protein